MKITKQDIRDWIEEKRAKFQGQFMNAEEREDDEAMEKASEKESNLDEFESYLEEIN